jgi:diketogulonate reductase-like aldo/keto reductase
VAERSLPRIPTVRLSSGSPMVAIPKSSSPERMAQNLDVLGFELSEDDVRTLDHLGR